MNKERHNHQVVYHYCQRCGRRCVLGTMQWQQGLLLCKENDCVDTVILGERDAAVARAVIEPTKELQPDDKLTNPGQGGMVLDIIV